MNTQLLYLAISLAGIAAMVGLCLLLFGCEVAKLDTRAAVARLSHDVPGFRLGHSALSADARSAVLENLGDGSFWLVTARGSDFVTRRLARKDVSARDGAALAFRFSDFTFPAAVIAFHDEDVARDWELRMSKA